jgi:mono/diheme cytochrome c family protein
MRICHAAIFVVAVGLTGSEVIAADVDHGADLAKRWCATCHVVDSDQRQASAEVPTFLRLLQLLASQISVPKNWRSFC